MSEWTESMLRTAASWQAFKEGRALVDAGLVTDAVMGVYGWKGAVRQGKRIFRVSVTAKSATDIDTRCPCPANQATGALCPHAVAVALAAIQGPAEKEPATPVPAACYEILLPENWRTSLAHGKLAATLVPADSCVRDSADDRLATWLDAQNGSGRLHLSGQTLARFLDAICDHSRVIEMKSRDRIDLRDSGRLTLAASSREGENVTLIPAGDDWFEIGDSAWRIESSSLVRLGRGPRPLSFIPGLIQGHSATLPIIGLLENLDACQQWMRFPDNDWLENLHFTPARAGFELHLDGSPGQIEARPLVRYGDALPVAPGRGKVAGLPRLSGEVCHVRDFERESAACHQLRRAGFSESDESNERWQIRGEKEVATFIGKAMAGLSSDWEITESPRFLAVRKQCLVISPKIEILGEGDDGLVFDLKFKTSDGNIISTSEAMRLLRSGGGGSGKRMIFSSDQAELIEPLFAELDLQQEQGRYRTHSATAEIIKELRKNTHNKNKSSGLCVYETFALPATLQADLRPYQQQGAGWVLDRLSRYGGALLADDMGLGKTIQTIAVIERLFDTKTDDSGVVLVIATASLLGNWKAEINRFAPARQVRILHGAVREKEQAMVVAGDVVLTSYSTLARDLAWHLRREYRAVVVDEASMMRNPDTDHAKAIAKLNSGMRLALTGTPVENGVRDLWSIFRFIQPGWLGSREHFREFYERAFQSGDPSVVPRLRLKISPFLLRRTKEQVAPELPSRIFINEFCELSEDQRAVYRELLVEGRKRIEAFTDARNQGAARMQMLTALLRLRQTCCDLALLGNERFNRLLVSRRSAKLQRLLELMEEAISGGHKMLVFSQFQKQLLEIGKCVLERGWSSLRLDGQTRNRQDLVDRFQQADGPPIFLISLKAGGYGLNLTAADVVVHFDPWWNPAAEAQATDRAHRIGQTRPVTVYRLLTRGTVEEKVTRLQAKKRELASAIDDDGGGDAPGWSERDLAELLKSE